MLDEAPLGGGTMSQVSRIGNTIRRDTGQWTSAVHGLLRYLETVGFEEAPRLLGQDSEGREILKYIEGTAGFVDGTEVRPDYLWSDLVLVDAARWLRRFHDVTTSYVGTLDNSWHPDHPESQPHEVICHNDFGPYNCIFDEGRLKAVIDFDMVGPGSRVWDVAYGAYRFVPLVAPESLKRFGLDDADTGRRLNLFCDAYGLVHREGFVRVLGDRIDATRRMMVNGARRGNVTFQRLSAQPGRVDDYRRDVRYVRANDPALQACVEIRTGTS